MAKWRTIGRATCGLLLVVSLICLGWTILPGARKQVKLVPAPLHFNNDTLALAEFQLDLPLTASQGGDDLLRLRMDATGVGTQHPVLVTARLELLSADLEPGAEIQIPMVANGFTRFEWNIHWTGEGELNGTLWLTLQLGDESQTVLAYPLSFTERTLAGLNFPKIRLLGWIGLLAALAGLAISRKRY